MPAAGVPNRYLGIKYTDGQGRCMTTLRTGTTGCLPCMYMQHVAALLGGVTPLSRFQTLVWTNQNFPHFKSMGILKGTATTEHLSAVYVLCLQHVGSILGGGIAGMGSQSITR